MSVYKDEKRNTWYVKFYYRNWQNERKWITKRGFTTKREAVQFERDFLARKSGSPDITFSEFVKNYLEDCQPRLKESTHETKTNIIETKLLPYFGAKRLCDISNRDVMLWQNTMLNFRDPVTKKPYTKSYLKTIHNQLSAIMNHAVKYYNLAKNPAAIVGNMGTDKGVQMKFWTKDEYMKFAEYMMDEPVGYYYFQILYWCGLREGEALALTMADFDFAHNTVTVSKTFQHLKGRDVVTEPKTPKSNRTVKMPTFLADEIQYYINTQDNLHPDERIFPLSKSYLYRKMEQGSQKQNLQRIRVHDLRHSHVSLLIDMGYSALAIADRMGHESVDITYRYAHLFPSVQAKMAADLDALIGRC